jgi:hypothetical protein
VLFGENSISECSNLVVYLLVCEVETWLC